jgi:hypothetical protein
LAIGIRLTEIRSSAACSISSDGRSAMPASTPWPAAISVAPIAATLRSERPMGAGPGVPRASDGRRRLPRPGRWRLLDW